MKLALSVVHSIRVHDAQHTARVYCKPPKVEFTMGFFFRFLQCKHSVIL